MHRSGQPAQVAEGSSPAVSASLADALRVVSSAASVGEARATTPAAAQSATAAVDAAPAAADPSAADPSYRDVSGGSRSKLLFSGEDSAPNRPGGTRSSIIHRPDGAEGGGLLAGTPVGSVLDSAVSTVSQAVPLPVDVTVSVPGVTGSLEAPLSVTAQLPAGQSVAVQVPPALSGVLGGILQPVSDALTGLTATP
jgi:hypothetical protein